MANDGYHAPMRSFAAGPEPPDRLLELVQEPGLLALAQCIAPVSKPGVLPRNLLELVGLGRQGPRSPRSVLRGGFAGISRDADTSQAGTEAQVVLVQRTDLVGVTFAQQGYGDR